MKHNDWSIYDSEVCTVLTEVKPAKNPDTFTIALNGKLNLWSFGISKGYFSTRERKGVSIDKWSSKRITINDLDKSMLDSTNHLVIYCPVINPVLLEGLKQIFICCNKTMLSLTSLSIYYFMRTGLRAITSLPTLNFLLQTLGIIKYPWWSLRQMCTIPWSISSRTLGFHNLPLKILQGIQVQWEDRRICYQIGCHIWHLDKRIPWVNFLGKCVYIFNKAIMKDTKASSTPLVI